MSAGIFRKRHLTVIFFLVMIFVTVFGLSAGAAVDGLMIESFSKEQDIATVGKKASFTVKVIEVAAGEQGVVEGTSPAENAVVQVAMTDGSEVLQRKLTKGQDGVYSGSVTFPEAGTWEIAVLASYPGDKAAVSGGESTQNVLEATWTVDEPFSFNFLWWIAAAVLVIVVVFWLSKRNKAS